jgi:hypothetical protein
MTSTCCVALPSTKSDKKLRRSDAIARHAEGWRGALDQLTAILETEEQRSRGDRASLRRRLGTVRYQQPRSEAEHEPADPRGTPLSPRGSEQPRLTLLPIYVHTKSGGHYEGL